MPKGGLSAMIAIGENVDNKYFNDATKDYLNFIRVLFSFEASFIIITEISESQLQQFGGNF